MPKNEIKKFIEALDQGFVCLHPSDTIPGLTFNPSLAMSKSNINGFELIQEFKKRTFQKPFIALVSDFEKAQVFWQPLPNNWDKVISTIWPAPVSFIWQAANDLPSNLLNQDKTIALRSPNLPVQYDWFYEVLRKCHYPLPTTSINISGEAPAYTLKDAITLLSNKKGFYLSSSLKNDTSSFVESSPSTLIKIERENSCKILRQGRVSVDALNQIFKDYNIKIEMI